MKLRLLSLTIITVVGFSLIMPVVFAVPTQERVCPRIAKRFSGNQKMLKKINQRIIKRFGFSCENYVSSNGVRNSNKQRSNFSKPYCKNRSDGGWNCGTWSDCRYENYAWMQYRKCSPDLNNQCIPRGNGPFAQTCTPSASAQKSHDDQIQKQNEEARRKSEEAQLQKYHKSTIKNYDIMVLNREEIDSQIPYFSGSTSQQLFQIANAYTDQVIQMKIYYERAKNGLLQASDAQITVNIIDIANVLLDRFNSISGSAIQIQEQQFQQQKQQQKIEYEYLLQQQNKQERKRKIECEQLEVQLRGYIASKGTNFDSNGIKWMYQELLSYGCVTQKEYCEAGYRTGINMSGTPLRWSGCK